MSSTILDCAGKSLDLSKPRIMGILNTTPDSFSDGGNSYQQGRLDLDLALKRAAQMQADGASIIDVGGESTRPGAAKVSAQEEMDRVIPVVERIAKELDVIISVDSSSPALMKEAAEVGAGLINDVRALQREGAVEMAAELKLPVCLMHMQGQPGTMQDQPEYSNVVEEVTAFLSERVDSCVAAGIDREQIILDPGFGFGKTLEHNVELLRNMSALKNALGLPVLAGLSRKSMLQGLLQRPVEQRLAGSLGVAMLALQQEAAILRVHDVAESRDILELYWQIEASR
ncbi:dihydropteroate synthase [Pseudoteredinibacter isoporae]|uniref:Dihydropteroate synthase n=1 Tax=Pseudoteredinibacter isoporae TaxID=570281 RepID=A0A7X0JS12_9GAMM|nr:dihydropteroate synthase [Pseudoteredinibacter isoporae]MBB6521210.1 dihydropteroate synthase [Pseudoteredinibacter isoporae]NHO86770.1 dihydropteroate synthase [Pseudoteredinibacter isoporae]NIB24778.1 dihydropteroate synthase [Pseudoteredinibacter isoporae]